MAAANDRRMMRARSLLLLMMKVVELVAVWQMNTKKRKTKWQLERGSRACRAACVVWEAEAAKQVSGRAVMELPWKAKRLPRLLNTYIFFRICHRAAGRWSGGERDHLSWKRLACVQIPH